jgi:NAD(P)-dependent dehydrogenase (short-subunit alcohol dehydrogenase family)
MENTELNVLVFGSSGTLGNSIVKEFALQGCTVSLGPRDLKKLTSDSIFDSVIWAQGMNESRSLRDSSAETEIEIFNANYFFVTESLRILLAKKFLATNARLVILGSIWSELGKENKSSYAASKAAVTSLVRSLVQEQDFQSIAINVVSPGIVDSKMTRQNLTKHQIESIKNDTPGNEIVTSEEVSKIVYFLASGESHGINGQNIVIDNGWSIGRNV